MKRVLISPSTRNAFREILVGFVLREIDDFFDAGGVPWNELPADRLVGGQRRSRVEEYYASVDWSDWSDVKGIIAAYESILIAVDARSTNPHVDQKEHLAEFEKLIRLLRRDGFRWEEDRLLPEHGMSELLPKIDSFENFDGAALREHLRRIEDGIVCDPALAIGSAKELVESVSKMVLYHYSEPTEKSRENLAQLVGRALDRLDLKAEKVRDAALAADASRKVLGSLAGIVSGMAEIRNNFGTGHGRHTANGITARHAHLMVGAAATLCHFMMATYEDRIQRESKN